MTAKILRIEVDTAACRHNPGEYFGLVVWAEIDGQQRRFFLRTSESMYPGNDAMLSILTQLEKEFHK